MPIATFAVGTLVAPVAGSKDLYRNRKPRRATAKNQREGGYLLLAVMLMMAFMVIAAAFIVGPNMVQQIKRDREEEMIHRGTEYARAIKKFYKKNGRYPASLDDLDKGQVRFLRHRYKDPLTKDGKWKLLQYGDIQALLNTAAPGTPAGALNQGGLNPAGALSGTSGLSPVNNSPFGGGAFGSGQPLPNQGFQLNIGGQNPGPTGGFPTGSDQGNAGGGSLGFGSSTNTASQNVTGGNQSGTGGNSPFGQNTGPGQNFGGGAVVGVASLSKDPTIRIYNKKKKYNEWQFIYNPMMDQQNVLLRGPYQPTTIGSRGIGTPAGQLGSQQNNLQQNGLPNNSGVGQQPGSGQQPNQLTPPGGNYPPDQNQQQ